MVSMCDVVLNLLPVSGYLSANGTYTLLLLWGHRVQILLLTFFSNAPVMSEGHDVSLNSPRLVSLSPNGCVMLSYGMFRFVKTTSPTRSQPGRSREFWKASTGMRVIAWRWVIINVTEFLESS